MPSSALEKACYRRVVSESPSMEMNKSNPRSNEQFSVFGETTCGEPMVPQRLVIDFTPNDEDTDFVQRKICTFWKFIKHTPEIKNLKVVPDRGTSYSKMTREYAIGEASESRTRSLSTNSDPHSDVTVDVDGTAVSKLEFVEQKGLINRIFEAKMEQSVCTLGSREYKENARNTPSTAMKKKPVCKCTTICEVCSGVNPLGVHQDSPVKKLCKQMKEWDATHHKSMAVPGHPPSLIHSVLQRKVYPLK